MRAAAPARRFYFLDRKNAAAALTRWQNLGALAVGLETVERTDIDGPLEDDPENP